MTLPTVAQAQFNCSTNFYTVHGVLFTWLEITGYTGTGGAVFIPYIINSLPVTSIGGGAFYACSSLTSVTIELGIVDLGDRAFANCGSLTNVMVPASIATIGDGAFSGCTSLTAITVNPGNSVYSSVDGVLFNKSQTTLIFYPEGKAGTYSLPSSVTGIGEHAFRGCTNLSSVTIPNSVTNIGDDAFYQCLALTNVTIGKGVATIGMNAFYGCTNLISVTIPDSVTNIWDSAFQYCTSLTSVTIGNNLSNMYGEYAFANCTSLTNVTIGTSVTFIGVSDFAECYRLTSVYFMGNAPYCLYDAFYGDNPIVYYLPGTTGWSTNLAGLPTVLWTPHVQTGNGSFGVRTNQFGFNINWASGMTVVVEASTSLVNPTWSPLKTNTLKSSTLYFTDPQWKNYPSRFYRFRMP